MTNALLRLLAVDHPIVQAPMAGTSSPAMAAEVSNAGGLGSLGLAAMGAEGARAAIAEFRDRSPRSLNVNVFCHATPKANPAIEAAWLDRLRPEFRRFDATPPASLRSLYTSFLADDAMLAVLAVAKPTVVSFHFGAPTEAQARALRQAGIVLVGTATSLDEGKKLALAGMQAIVAQGYEAGGHRGVFDPDGPDDRLTTFALTRVLAKALPVPVLAAGGIMDGAGIAAALRLGASAAQLGTAFVACPESLADAGHRAALMSDAANHTVMTRVISGRPARCLANRFTALAGGVQDGDVPRYPIAYDAGKQLDAAAKAKGEPGFGAQWAGQGAPMARALPAGRLVVELVAEMA
jgi:nitronate monooxygenase